MTDIFREIDEELRYDKVQRIWQRYRILIVAAVAALILGTIAYVVWQDYAERQAVARAQAFAAALELTGEANPETALLALEQVAEAGGGYEALARLQQAAVELRAGNTDAALAIYDGLATDGSVHQVFRDVAVILFALNALDTAEPDTLIARLAPLTAEESAWRYSARELTALLRLRKDDIEGARETLTALAADPGAPQGVRLRAEELLAGLGS